MTDLEQLLRQAKSQSEFSTILSSFKPPVLPEPSFADPDYDFCSTCQSFISDDESSVGQTCVNCMPYGFSSRVSEAKERRKSKNSKQTQQTVVEQIKPLDNNIDDLVRFIDGQDNSPVKPASSSKKNKKKKGKANPSTLQTIEPESSIVTVSPKSRDSSCVSSLSDNLLVPPKLQESPTIPIVSTRSSTASEKANSVRSSFDSPSESCSPAEEEEVNWITIARKQTKPKATAATTRPEQKRPQKPTKSQSKKTLFTQPPVPLLQQNVITPTVNSQTRTSNQPKQATVPAREMSQKRPAPSAWATVTTHEPEPGTNLCRYSSIRYEYCRMSLEKPISTLMATAPAFIPSLTFGNETSSAASSLSVDDATSSLFWNPSSSHLFPLGPGPVQRPTSSASRCIQRPSSEPRTSPFPQFPSTDQHSSSNSNESLWQYSDDTPSSRLDDFPLYNPFKSGADGMMPASSLLTSVFSSEERYRNFSIPKDDLQDPWENLQFSDEQSLLRYAS